MSTTTWLAALALPMLLSGCANSAMEADDSRRGTNGTKADNVSGSCTINDCGAPAANGSGWCNDTCASFGDCAEGVAEVCGFDECETDAECHGDDLCVAGPAGPMRCESQLDENGTLADDGSGIGCIFGDHLVSMARAADLITSASTTLDANSPPTGIQLQQFLDATESTTLAEAWDMTDEAEVSLHTVRDTAHQREFNMYIWYAGDTVVGGIYYSKSLRVAGEIGDGGISKCDAKYSNFDALPFFYVN